MSISVRAALLSLATLNLAIGGCARSGSGALDEATEQELAKASQEAAEALAGSQANADAIDDLTTRVDAVGDVGDRISAVEDEVDGVAQDVADLDTRLDGIEMDWPPRDDSVVIDDEAAAGFPAGVAANAEQGFAHVNTRLDIQSGRIGAVEFEMDSLESQVGMIGDSFLTNIETTVTTVVQEAAANGTITVDADLSFDPGAGVDPRADAADTYPEYGAAASLEDAIRALRWANQVKFTPPESDTRLGGLARNYVQEAIVALDRDVYDIVNGNLAIDLAPGTTVDGSPLDTYIQNAVLGDTTYLGDLFATNEFVTAVTNLVTGGGAGVGAAAVVVDPTNLAADGYDNAQEALESLYARSGANAADLATLEGRVDVTETDIDGLTTTITSLQTALAALNAASIAFDNTNSQALLVGNNNAYVQGALDDLYAHARDLEAQLATIGAGGVVTDASNVTYGQNGQATVRNALDQLNAALDATQAIVGNGNYVTDGQLVNEAVLALDTALYATELLADDLDVRVSALEAQVQANTTAIAANAAAIDAGEAAIAVNTAAITANGTAIAANTADIADNASSIAANAAALAALRSGDDATFNAFLDARIAAAVNDLIQERVQPLEDAVAVLQNARNAYILGLSAQTSTGAFNFGGKQGVEAATEMCRQTFDEEANAHLCSLDEIQNALATSSYNTANAGTWDNVATWTISGVHAFYSGGAYNAANDYNPGADSLTTSCHNFLYNSADVAKGTTVRVDLDFNSFGVGGDGKVGDAYRVQPGVGCGTALPVLCCR